MHMFYCLWKEYNRLLQISSATFLPIIIKMVNIWLSYSENQKGELFWNTL